LMGVVVFFPWLDTYARWIEKISGKGVDTAVSRLEPTLAEAGGPIALEAVWRATLETAQGPVDAVRRRLIGESVDFSPPADALRHIEKFLESLSLETLDLRDVEPRLVRLNHAIDHLKRLDEVLSAMPASQAWTPPPAFEAAASALDAWLKAEQDPAKATDPKLIRAIAAAAEQCAAEHASSRTKILEAVALQQTSAATGREALDTLFWADRALHHCWRMIDSLREAAGDERRDVEDAA
jgi:phosphate:Na+ symporter